MTLLDRIALKREGWRRRTAAYRARHPRKRCRPLVARLCAECGDVFFTNQRHQAICGDLCHRQHKRAVSDRWDARNPEKAKARRALSHRKWWVRMHPPKTVQCQVCGINFVKGHRRLYCSPLCARELHRTRALHRYRAAPHRQIINAECAVCGSSFTKTRGAQKSCSECRARLRAESLKHNRTQQIAARARRRAAATAAAVAFAEMGLAQMPPRLHKDDRRAWKLSLLKIIEARA